ncbi:TIGR04211 family SH3 domain-containing protein [Gilvimarinus sp. F26214L]|uniref:TIGR04211 family SH3 domain-containing protein n=1 Tax=Gilvimarinus sp. DZF01 TaxID=3461371 RepID=UPI004045C07C
MSKSALITFVLILLFSAGTFAQTRYVSDELRINMRAGQGNQFRITKILPSGTRMTVLEEGETGEWVHVRTQAGDEGWVRDQYLQDQPIARDRLTQAQARIQELTRERQELGGQSSSLQEENQRLSSELQTSQAEVQRLSSELEELQRISGNAITLNQTNKELMEERQLLETEIEVLQAENERLSDDTKQTWFLYGAMAVGIGVILTLIIQALRSRRRYSEWG